MMALCLKMDWRDFLSRLFLPVFHSNFSSARACLLFMIIGKATMNSHRLRLSWNPWLWLKEVALVSLRYPCKTGAQRSEMESTSSSLNEDTKSATTTTTFPDDGEIKSVRIWNTESSISSILLTRDGIIYGTRYGLVGEVKFQNHSMLQNNIHDLDDEHLTCDHNRPRRWWTGNNEIIAIAKISKDGYLVMDGVKMSLLNQKGSQPIRGFYGGLTLATTTRYGLLGTMNAVCVMNLTTNSFESQCFKDAFQGDFRYEFGEPIHNAAIKGNMAVCCGQRNAYVFDLNDPVGEKKIITASDSITSIAFSDAMILVMATTNGQCQSWDVMTRDKPLATFGEHKGAVYSMDITQNGTQTAIGSSAEYAEDFTVYIWDTHLGTLLYQLAHHTDLISGVAFSPSGSFLITASWDGTIHQVDLKHGDRSRFVLFLRRAKKTLPDDVLKLIFSFLI